jgi:hypothetical protein
MTIILCQIQWLASLLLGNGIHTETLNLECNLDGDTPSQNKKSPPPLFPIKLIGNNLIHFLAKFFTIK